MFGNKTWKTVRPLESVVDGSGRTESAEMNKKIFEIPACTRFRQNDSAGRIDWTRRDCFTPMLPACFRFSLPIPFDPHPAGTSPGLNLEHERVGAGRNDMVKTARTGRCPEISRRKNASIHVRCASLSVRSVRDQHVSPGARGNENPALVVPSPSPTPPPPPERTV